MGLAHTPSFAVAAERSRRAGQFDRAITLCREGLAEFPGFIAARVTLGCALVALDKVAEGRAELEAVRRDAPDNLAAIRALAELHDRTEAELTTVAAGQAIGAAEAASIGDEPPAPIAAAMAFAPADPVVELPEWSADSLPDWAADALPEWTPTVSLEAVHDVAPAPVTEPVTAPDVAPFASSPEISLDELALEVPVEAPAPAPAPIAAAASEPVAPTPPVSSDVIFDHGFDLGFHDVPVNPPAPVVVEPAEPVVPIAPPIATVAPRVDVEPREWKPVVSSPEPVFRHAEVLPPLPALDFSAPVARRSVPEPVDMSEQAVAMRQVAALEQLLARVQARRGRRAVA
jgi:hypothetical protein